MYVTQCVIYILSVKEILEQSICSYHCPEGSPMYVEAVNSSMLPNVLYIYYR